MKRGIGLMAYVAMMSGGCTVSVTEAQMQDRAQVTQLTQKVSTEQNNRAHLKRIAFIGLETPNQLKDRNVIHVGGRIGEVVNTIEAAKEAAENRKELACRALDASFDQFAKSLADAGFELVPFEDKLKQPEFSLFTGSPPPDWCQATRAPARMNYLNPFKWKDTFRVVQQLIDALGVDAIVMGQLSANGVQNGVSSLFAYVKGADGVASVGWSGKVSKGKFQFDSAGKEESDQTKLANAARVFAHTFELLATKMGAETK